MLRTSDAAITVPPRLRLYSSPRLVGRWRDDSGVPSRASASHHRAFRGYVSRAVNPSHLNFLWSHNEVKGTHELLWVRVYNERWVVERQLAARYPQGLVAVCCRLVDFGRWPPRRSALDAPRTSATGSG